MNAVKTAFFVKNVPTAERVVRVLGSVGLAALAFAFLSSPWSYVTAASAIGFAMTGLVGFCPMCALAGRKLE